MVSTEAAGVGTSARGRGVGGPGTLGDSTRRGVTIGGTLPQGDVDLQPVGAPAICKTRPGRRPKNDLRKCTRIDDRRVTRCLGPAPGRASGVDLRQPAFLPPRNEPKKPDRSVSAGAAGVSARWGLATAGPGASIRGRCTAGACCTEAACWACCGYHLR